ncbi:MAG: hypothetical protein HKN47_01135 [Pirellulaceae bacterium]|nr:hypothetical protein [Pirellulaceae bacterium]
MLPTIKFVLKTCLVAAVATVAVAGQATADDAKKSDKRPTFREDRPDDSRGWVIVTKRSYWPLCYESLDRIEEAQALIGSADKEELATAFEKAGAWLGLAASASMAEQDSMVSDVGNLFDEAAVSIANGSNDWSDAELSSLSTLGLIAMTQSHVMRANDNVEDRGSDRGSAKSKVTSKEVKAIEKEIATDKVQRDNEQYVFDAKDAQRHLTVAQSYLAAAGKSGKFDVDASLTKAIPALTAKNRMDTTQYVEDELREKADAISKFIATKKSDLSKQLQAKL